MQAVDYTRILETERLRVSQLENELNQHKALIAALTALTGLPTNAPELKAVPSKTNTPEEDRLPTYIRKDSLPLLRAITDQALSADDITTYCRQAGISVSRETVLFRLGMYRRKYGMVENSDSGLFQLTEKGKKYMAVRYPEQSSSGKAPDASPTEPEPPKPVMTDQVPSLWE